jgi:uncharacterized protein (DUF952 family)
MQTRAFKILSISGWEIFQRDGVMTPEGVDISDGYVHLSTADQCGQTLSLWFRGRTDIVVLEIDLTRFGADLKWEASRGGALFPHLYSVLPIEAVVRVLPVRLTDAGVPEVDL